MSATKFKTSYVAAAQLELLPQRERADLKRLFASGEIDRPAITRPTGDGRFVSRIGSKRVLWRRAAQDDPEILSIVDKSFAIGG